MNNDDTQNAWHYRIADLSQYAGKTIAAAWITTDSWTGAGHWEEYFSDIAFYRTDGTVVRFTIVRRIFSILVWIRQYHQTKPSRLISIPRAPTR